MIILLFSAFMRIWKISEVPVSLFGDELDVGYQAYSILKTGRDYNGNFMPLHFHSLAEWRTPLYLYSCVPSVAIFGISPLGVRLPAVIFGILNILGIYLLSNKLVKEKWKPWGLKFGLIPALLLAISPWHIQYSRAAFEVTQLLFFYLFGLYLFFVALEKPKYLWLSAFSLMLTPWVYSSAKLFTPFLLLFLLIVWFKEIFRFPVKELIKSIFVLLVLGLPMAYSIFFGGGSQRYGYISVFTDPTMEGDVGFARLNDAAFEGDGRDIFQKVSTRLIHNKYFFWSGKILKNYYSSFSTDFLFNMGDLNRRHNIEGMGEFYKIDIIPLILGIILFTTLFKDKRIKLLIIFWILAGAFPSAITRDGGNHATRLIIILPPLIILMSYGIAKFSELLGDRKMIIFQTLYGAMLLFSFYLYQHNYWIHNPWYSERWWHAGFEGTVNYLKINEGNYDKIIFSNANEPPFIFFAGWYQYPPSEWQKGFTDANISGFSLLKNIGKYYFGQMEKIGIYELAGYLPEKTIYVATEREVGVNLIREPNRTPPGLKLLKAVAYPSGEPAFYIFTHIKKSGFN